MKTIKAKLITLFMVIMITLVLSGMLFHSIGLKSYYIYKYRDIFLSVFDKIKNNYPDKNYASYIIQIRDMENISTTIADETFTILYSDNLTAADKKKRLKINMQNKILNDKETISKKYLYYMIHNKNIEKTSIVFISKMKNGDYIILRKPIKNISESVQIANQFYMVAGIFVILFGGICILIFSKKITEPIIEMSKVTENIANLDFDKRVAVTSQDEIAKLGENINKISEKLSTSIQELKDDVESRKQLIRNMSHELKTPIGIIKGYAEGLKYGVADNQQQIRKYCDVLVEESDRMDRLVREMLDLSAMEAAMVTLNKTNFEVNEFLLDIVNRFQFTLADKGITFHFEPIKDHVITADRGKLEKAVNNYITNAIDYAEGRNYIALNVEEKGKGVEISVFNTGSHIPDEECKKIWNVYYKADKARTRKYGGNGMGLAIVKSIIELHGGCVTVKNVEEGVLFSFYLPE